MVALDTDSRASLFAYCVSLTVNAVHGWERRPCAWAHANVLGVACGSRHDPLLDGHRGGATSSASPRARIGEAVGEAVSAEAVERISGLKKPEMVEAAEQLVAGSGWLPPLLRTEGAALPAAVQSMAVAAE